MLGRILNSFRLSKSERGDAYRRRVAEANSPSDIVAGKPSDRVQGLDVVLGRCAGKSVVDIGCHDGSVAAAFSDHGASFIDGVDLSRISIDAARTRLIGSSADVHFETVDLVKGMSALRAQLRRDSYDIVCYLGVHQHLRKQLSTKKLIEFEEEIFSLAGQIVIVRTSRRFMDDINQRLTKAEFRPITDLLYGEVGPVRSYERYVVKS